MMGTLPSDLPLTVGTLDLDAGRVIHHSGAVVDLTALELRLVRFLHARRGAAAPICEIYRDVWGYSAKVQSRAIDKLLSRLRKKLERDSTEPEHVVRVPGEGLALRIPQTQTPACLMGRQAEFEQLEALLRDASLVTLTGIGGIGKSKLAHAVLSKARAHTRRETVQVDVSVCGQISDLSETMGRALGLGDAGAVSLGCALAELGPAFVFLDNASHLAGSLRPLLEDWMREAPLVTFLLTSRVPTHAGGEARLHLDSLAPPAAIALFSRRARELCPDYSVSETERPILEELLRRLDHLPLAIEFAANRTRLLSARQLLTQLTHRVDFLRDHRGVRPERHRSLFEIIAQSWRLLTTREQAALKCLAVFAGSFSVQAAQLALSEDPWPLDRLQVLVDKSLLDVIDRGGEPRLRMKACVRGFLRSQPTPLPVSRRSVGPALQRGKVAR